MKIIDNVNDILKNDLQNVIKPNSNVSIVAACFSIYAYEELKEQLTNVDQLRFIFTSPSFITEKTNKIEREYYIPRHDREQSLFGSEFELKLKNMLSQKAIAQECATWIREKATFKSNQTTESMMGFMAVDKTSYVPLNGFTSVDLGCERGNNAYSYIQKNDYPDSKQLLSIFENLWNDKNKLQDVTEKVLDNISSAYRENSPEFVYFVALYNIFNEFLEDINEDELPNEASGYKDSKIWDTLYNFQRDAAVAIINKLEKFNGCILADSVGLGKTFTALSVIKYYENRNKSVLVLCPKKLAENWNTYKDNYINNPIASDRLNYTVLFHTDLNRDHGYSNGLDLSRINWSNYDLIVIDESHNFRNGGKISSNDEDPKENRYLKLMNKVIKKGVNTKVLMLSATPVNNKFSDLKNQLQLAYEGNTEKIDAKLDTSHSINEIFKSAQTAFNTWSKQKKEERTTINLLKMLDFDFFELLDSVTIARSRKHIEEYYDTAEIGTFPTRLSPISYSPELTDLKKAITYSEIFEQLYLLNLSLYTPTKYIQPSKKEKYEILYDQASKNKKNHGITQVGREEGIRRLTAINLMKRMESSVYSFNLTIARMIERVELTLKQLSKFKKHIDSYNNFVSFIDFDNIEEDDDAIDPFTIGTKVKIEIEDIDYISWESDLKYDLEILQLIHSMVKEITPDHDLKLKKLLSVLSNKIQHPINKNNKKVLVFTAFSDTAEYLYEHVSKYIKINCNIDSAMITGSASGKSTVSSIHCDFNTILTLFSPESKDKNLLLPNSRDEIDILIATDCISEGQNLQDCDYVINYDIHWNPVRIIQRFGRIDRIGSHNKCIQLVNFWPNVTLDEYINLKARVETRMKIVNMTATADENILSQEEQADLDYRKDQLKRLQTEVVNIEEMGTGLSIMDLGLNEFRLDLVNYFKDHPELETIPWGLSSVIPSTENNPPGVIFVLKNTNEGININKQNRLHPFYLVYVKNDGQIICNHLNPKNLLDRLRFLSKGKSAPIESLYIPFNRETKDGKDMSKYSNILKKAITSIIDVKEESDILSFIGGKNVSFTSSKIQGIDDFNLVCFFIVR